MPFLDSFPLRAMGPRSDTAFASGKFDASSSGTVLTRDANTGSGFSITSVGSGVYTFTHPKCRFSVVSLWVAPATPETEANERTVVITPGADPTAGTLTFRTRRPSTEAVVASEQDLQDGDEVHFIAHLGF